MLRRGGRIAFSPEKHTWAAVHLQHASNDNHLATLDLSPTIFQRQMELDTSAYYRRLLNASPRLGMTTPTYTSV